MVLCYTERKKVSSAFSDGGTHEEMETFFFDYLRKSKALNAKFIYVVEAASQRHLHMGVICSSRNLGDLLRQKGLSEEVSFGVQGPC